MANKTTSTTTQAEFHPRALYGASKILRHLWQRADFSTMSDEELAEFDCHDNISHHLSNLADLMMGVGCLIANDDRKTCRSGALQMPENIAEMLWAFSDLIATNVEAIDIASEANFHLMERAKGRR